MAGVLDPQGPIATQERDLIVTAFIIMLVVAIPLLIALYTFAWRYRAGKKNVKYEPDHAGSVFKQLLWWAIPGTVIVIIAVMNWKSTHVLDPYNPIVSNVQPLTIQVVALRWKWLFIYPAQGIATVNYVQFPEKTPVHFELTADAPMSSFWIPQLGSQIYAMAAMQTQLNLMADTTGEYAGKDTEINGAGYAGMTFMAKSTSEDDFNAWVTSVQQTSSSLTMDEYDRLAEPSQNNAPAYYASFDKNLYNTVLMKDMIPPSSSTPALSSGTSSTEGMSNSMPGMHM